MSVSTRNSNPMQMVFPADSTDAVGDKSNNISGIANDISGIANDMTNNGLEDSSFFMQLEPMNTSSNGANKIRF